MQTQTYVTSTIYHLYICLLQAYNLKAKQNSPKIFLLLTDNIPQVMQFQQKLENLKLFDTVYLLQVNKKDCEYGKTRYFFKRIFFREPFLRQLYKEDISEDLYKILELSEINLFVDASQLVQLLFKCFPDNYFRLFEDGERIYMNHKGGIKDRIKQKLLGYPLKYGRDKQIKEVVVQHPDKLPPILKGKGKKIDLNKLVEKLDETKKEQIARLFLPGDINTDYGAKKLLLITQPLSEDGYVTEEYKLNLYKKIIAQYGKGFQIFIKPHPREKTDYSCHIPCELLPQFFPIEILDINKNYSFDRGVTLFSTALKNTNQVKEKIFLGIDWDKKVAKKFPFKN